MHAVFLSRSSAAIPLVPLTAKGLGPWTKDQPDNVKRLVDAAGFKADAGKALLVHGADGAIAQVLVGLSMRRRRADRPKPSTGCVIS